MGLPGDPLSIFLLAALITELIGRNSMLRRVRQPLQGGDLVENGFQNIFKPLKS